MAATVISGANQTGTNFLHHDPYNEWRQGI